VRINSAPRWSTDFAARARIEQDEEGIVKYLIDVISTEGLAKKVIALEIVYNLIADGTSLLFFSLGRRVTRRSVVLLHTCFVAAALALLDARAASAVVAAQNDECTAPCRADAREISSAPNAANIN
jgi:hypothetical protein